MGNFDHRSNYTKNAGITSVVFGSNSPVLEVELNELQQIQQKRLSDFFSAFIGNSISSKDAIVYENGVLTIGECCFIVDGNLIKCTGLSVSLGEGEHAYLKVKEMDATYVTALKEEGNQQSDTIVENNIKDDRYDFVSSMRTYISYDLVKSKSTIDGYTYVEMATVVDGQLSVVVEESSVGGGSGSVSFLEEDFGEDDDWEESV